MSLQRQDPMDEFPNITPIAVSNAAFLVREAALAEAAAVLTLEDLRDQVKLAQGVAEDAHYLRKAALHRLKISAMQPNGGEE